MTREEIKKLGLEAGISSTNACGRAIRARGKE